MQVTGAGEGGTAQRLVLRGPLPHTTRTHRSKYMHTIECEVDNGAAAWHSGVAKNHDLLACCGIEHKNTTITIRNPYLPIKGFHTLG